MEASTKIHKGSNLFFIDIHQTQSDCQDWMEKVKEIFKKEIEPLYGNQKCALLKIDRGEDRKCYLLRDEFSQVKGILVYKKGLSNEYEALGISNSLEVKTLMVLDSGEQAAQKLIKKIKKIARKLEARSIHLTANERSNFSLESLQRFGFQTVGTLANPIKKRDKEHLLRLVVDAKEKKGEDPDEWQLVQTVRKMGLSDHEPLVENFSCGRIKTIRGVHQDDIHGIIKLSDQTLITGSKDGSLKKWDLDGNLLKVVFDPGVINYKNWITALAPLNEEQWITGTRNGNTYLYNRSGKFIRDLNVEPGPYSQNSLSCKQRNVRRINCLASLSKFFETPMFFAGWPTQFTLHSAKMLRRIGHANTSSTDWVYAVQPISKESLLVVTGCRLEIWKDPGDEEVRWKLQSSLVQEEKVRPRPFISAITSLENADTSYGLAVFDGSVRVVDIFSGQTTYRKQEHQNRVWTIENISRNCFASCGDDGLIKLWDIRTKGGSVFTMRDNSDCAARVSILLLLNDNVLLSGSCPDDVKRSRSKAQFSFWDIRKK